MNMASKSPKSKSGSRRICVFCDQNDICQETYGKLLSKAGVTAHYFCMLFSSGLSQNGKSEKQGILGFLQSDIVKEVKRGARLRCSYCRKTGATIGCVIRNCKKMFHLGCGRNNNTLHQFFGTFSSFCPAHRVQQEVPSDDDPSIVCSICMNTVTAAPSNDTIRAPCCRKYWYHRDCVQRYATSAGLYFFKCPLCNNKDEFQDEMLTMGIYIPDQDASWEKEPHAFQELLERYSHCDAPVCKCVEGRKYDKEGSKWEIILCDFCGSHGAHVACNHLEKLGKHDICHGCKEVDERTREEEYLMNSPPSKRKSLELLQLELASSPDPSKGASPYPGPSDALRKVGLPSSQAGISPRASSSTKNKSSTKKGKRLASPETSENPPKVKKRKLYKRKSETVTSATAKGRRTADSLLSSNTSSQSSDDTSDDDLPFSVLKNKLNKMELESAWDVRRRKRMEYKKKHAEKKDKKKTKLYESDSEIDMKKKKELGGKKRKVYVEDSDESETAQTKQKEEKENRAKKSTGNANNNHTVSDSETDNCSQIVDVIKVKAHEKHESDKRLSLPVKISGKGKEKVKKTRKSADRLVVSPTIDQKVKQGKSKKRSLENDKNQTTLTSWLTQKPKQDLDKGHQAEQVQMNKKNKSEHVKVMIKTEHVNEKNKYEHVKVMNKTEPVPVNTAKNKKKPVVIEWMGKQLIIKSPKVVLRRNRSRKALKMRPKNLEIDMNDVKGCSDWNRDIDMLSNIETDVRVTRKMVDIDQRDTKNEKGITNLASPTRCPQKQEKVEHISPMKKTKNVGNFTKLSALELNNNEILTSVQTKRSGKVDLPFEGYSDSERPVESEGYNEMVEERVGSLILEELEDSPAKNLRGRKTREEISNSVSADSILRPAANVLKEFPDKNSPMKNIESLKSVLHQSPKSSVARADSPAKNLRPRMKRDQKRNTLDDETNPDNLEKENQHTPTMEKNCFNFTVIKDKKPSDDTELPPDKGSNLIRVKESAEFGSVILRNDTNLNEQFGSELNKTAATIERLKLYKPQMSVTSETEEDSPAKNLRKRNQTIKDHENNAYSEAVNVEEVEGKAAESDNNNTAVSDQLQRLKKYKPRFKYLNEGYGTDLKGKNSEKEENHTLDTMKVGKEVTRTSKDTTEVSDTSKQPSIIWHLEGTKQVNKSRPDYLNSGCENTCPNPQPDIIYANEANLDPVEKKTNSPRRKSFSLDDILEERLNEINNTFPTTDPELDSPEESCNTAASLSPSYFTKFRRSCSRSESLESFSSKASSSKISIENGAVVIRSTAPSPEQESPVLTFSQTKKNLLDAMRNKSVAKLRFSPRPKKPSAQGHASDKMSMAEYYGASFKSDPRLKKKSGSSVATDDEGNDIGELPSLISASIVM